MRVEYIMSFLIGCIIGLVAWRVVIANDERKLIDTQSRLIETQRKRIDQLKAQNDSLWITREEFDYAVKLLEERK